MFPLTKVTATRPNGLSKRYDLLGDRSLKKTSAAAMSKGMLETLTLARPDDLMAVIATLTGHSFDVKIRWLGL